MAQFFQKPENALKRAEGAAADAREELLSIWKKEEELEGVNQKVAALDTLENVIKSKRHRAWTPTLELILKKFLGLCTERREPRRAKEGLIQYRSIAANAEKGPASFLSVVNSFINDGEAAVKEAEKKAGLGADAVANLQDLEAEETPETMMISVLTNDLSDTGRADRDNYVQWLRFLWESYRACLEWLRFLWESYRVSRSFLFVFVFCFFFFRADRDNYQQWLRFLWGSCRACLEVLKNNPKLEKLYAETANKTFKFCVKYKRKVEFRRLKDLLKNHLTNAQLSHNVSPVNPQP
ncbi:hypothetical protein T484DRAFT_1814407 [Baffinella frigidus]|nr:hypothetical protein T484DRAFT_1814407 [Cryptophyta sp. CCMP2293]